MKNYLKLDNDHIATNQRKPNTVFTAGLSRQDRSPKCTVSVLVLNYRLFAPHVNEQACELSDWGAGQTDVMTDLTCRLSRVAKVTRSGPCGIAREGCHRWVGLCSGGRCQPRCAMHLLTLWRPAHGRKPEEASQILFLESECVSGRSQISFLSLYEDSPLCSSPGACQAFSTWRERLSFWAEKLLRPLPLQHAKHHFQTSRPSSSKPLLE